MGLGIVCGDKRLEKYFLAGSNNCSSLFKFFFSFASLISPALLPASIYLSWKWLQSWWKATHLWQWKWNPFGCRVCVKFTLYAVRQCKSTSPLDICTLLTLREVCVLSEHLSAQLHGLCWDSAGRASPSCCAITVTWCLLIQTAAWCYSSQRLSITR